MAPTEAEQASWEQMWLPVWPLASDELWRGIYRTPRMQAMRRRYVEANPQAWSNLLVVDVDHPDAALRALSTIGSHPMPNAIVENPRNGHAHAVWALHEPVTRTEYAHRKPLAYAAAVTEGLRRAVGGDKGYSGLMTKNPMHVDWSPVWLQDTTYDLDTLRHDLGQHMPPPGWTRTRRKNPVGLGRNCSIFETARTWAYREVRHHFGDSPGLLRAIGSRVHELNSEFTEPLGASEARAIGNSIHRWITTQSRMWRDGPAVYEATFIAIQSARGRKGGVASGMARRKRSAEAWSQA